MNDYSEWLKTLKADDEVVIVSSRNPKFNRIDTVDKTTPKRIKVGRRIYNRETGVEINTDALYQTSLAQPTPERVRVIREREAEERRQREQMEARQQQKELEEAERATRLEAMLKEKGVEVRRANDTLYLEFEGVEFYIQKGEW